MSFWYHFSIILSNCLLLLAFIYGIYTKQLWSNQQVRWYLIYLGFILGIEIITTLLIYIFDNNNIQSIYPFYVAGEFFILLQLFLTGLKVAKKWHLIVIFITILIFMEAIILWYLNDDTSTGYGKIFSHLTIVCMIAYLLVKNLKELETTNPLLIIYAALFLYYTVSLFLFLLLNQLINLNYNTASIIWIMNNTLSSILYSSSIYTFYRLKKSQ